MEIRQRLDALGSAAYGIVYGGSMVAALGAVVVVLAWAGSSARLWLLIPVIGYGAVMGIRAGRFREREQSPAATNRATDGDA